MANISDQMDEIFDDGLDFDVIFDNDDKLIDTVNGVKEDGTSLLGDEFEGLFDENGNFIEESQVSIPGEPNTDDGKADNTAGKSALVKRTTSDGCPSIKQHLNRDAESDGTAQYNGSSMAQVDDEESVADFRKGLGYVKESLDRIAECEILFESTDDIKYLEEIRDIVKEDCERIELDAIANRINECDILFDKTGDINYLYEMAEIIKEACKEEDESEVEGDPGDTEGTEACKEAEDLSVPNEPDTDDGKNYESANNAAAKVTMSNGQNQQKVDDNTSVGVKEAYSVYRIALSEGVDEALLEASLKKKIKKAKKAAKKANRTAKRATKGLDKAKKKVEKLEDIYKKNVLAVKETLDGWYDDNNYEINEYEESVMANFIDIFFNELYAEDLAGDALDESLDLERQIDFVEAELFTESEEGGDDDVEDDLIGTVDSVKGGSGADLDYQVGEDDILIDDLLN